jgi:predicted metal-dependent hydrolase
MCQSISDVELGKIVFKINPRSRHIFVRLSVDGVQITLPSKRYYDDGLRLLEKSRENLLLKKKQHQTPIDEEHPLQTLTFTTRVVAVDRPQLFFRLVDSVLTVEYPQKHEIHAPSVQSAIRKGIIYFLRQAAKRQLPPLLMQLSEKHGFKYSAIKIQESKTRWGSCSRTNSINLSLYLLLLPQHLIEYVILHELCHTVEHNHSDRFWILLRSVAPASDLLRKELSQHHIRGIF